jgi:hypothetical protein
VFISRKDYDAVVPLKGEDLATWEKMQKKWSLSGVTVEPKSSKEKALVEKLFGDGGLHKVARDLVWIAKELMEYPDLNR